MTPTSYNPQQKNGETYEIKAYLAGEVSEEEDGIKTLTFDEFIHWYSTGQISGLLIPIDNYMDNNSLTSLLMKNGVKLEDVYILPRVDEEVLDPDKLPKLITPYYSSKYLPYLEFHAADHCNLNCAACEHYSGLLDEEKYPKLDRLKEDLSKLHEFFDDIATIRILGGEPLLNPEINEIIKMTKQQYPGTFLRVVTNGLKLFSMSDSFFETLRDQGVRLDISLYPPLQERRAELESLLTKKQTLQPSDNAEAVFYNCAQAHCHNLYEGKIAACFLPFTTKYFNDYFHMEIPEDGAVDLYEEGMTTEIIKKALNRSFQRCAYCTSPVPIEWSTIHNPSVLSDWVNEASA